ncbi:MAG TPA: CoA transferase [Mycobacteriales bacterium]|nr:CoA transferase [Mycobacteriales bacterium]
MDSALSGVTVVDLTQVMAGPFCTQLLADFGARVIKVERPGAGDQSRRSMGHPMRGEDSAAFLAINRNKHSVAVDLKTARGRQLAQRMAGAADVFVQNFRPGVVGDLGLDYPTLSALNPGLVYASISGFGQHGPYVQRPGYDLIAQAMSGVMSVTGNPGEPPVKAGIPIGDLAAGLFTAFGVVSALHARGRTGLGQHVDVSLLDSAFALSVWETAELWSTGRVPGRLGSAHRVLAPYQALRARDGYLTVGANNDRQWRGLCATIGREDLLADPRFSSNTARLDNREPLAAELEATLRTRDVADWVADLLAAGVPCGPIQDYAQASADPQLGERDMVATVDHPVEGTMRVLGIPVRLSATPGRVVDPAPLLGQHTRAVLAWLGLSEREVDELFEQGVVA